MGDGSSRRTRVKQGVTLRTKTKRPGAWKISALDTRLRVMNVSLVLVCFVFPHKTAFSEQTKMMENLTVFASEVNEQKQSTKKTV